MWTEKEARSLLVSATVVAAVALSTCLGCATVSSVEDDGAGRLAAAREAARPAIQIVGAPYSATLLNYMETEMWRIDAPQSLRTYREAWKTWERAPVYYTHLDGSYWAYRRCSYTATTVDQMISCMQRVLPQRDSHTIRQAVTEADMRLRRRWPELRDRVGPVVAELQERLRGPTSRRMLARLTQIAALRSPQWTNLLRIVVVAGDEGSTWGHREAEYLLVQVDEGDTGDRALMTVLHEAAHYASRISPARDEVEREFSGHGHSGLIAANHWDESFALAFERLASLELDAEDVRPSRRHHRDPRVDALSGALFDRWRQGEPTVLGAAFVQELVGLSRAAWPRQRWRMRDFMWRMVVFSDDTMARVPFSNWDRFGGNGVRGMGIPSRLSRTPDMMPGAVTLILATNDTLRTRPQLLADLGLGPALPSVVERRAMLLRAERDGMPILLIAAPNPTELRRAAGALAGRADRDPLPTLGWHPL